MIGLTETGFISLTTAIVAGVTTVLVAFLARQNQRDQRDAREQRAQASNERQELVAKVTPTNGYETLGEAMESVEKVVNATKDQVVINTGVIKNINERLEAGEARFKRIEEKQAEQLAQHGEARGEIRRLAETMERIRAGFERDDPLRRRAVEEWGLDGTEGKKRRRR